MKLATTLVASILAATAIDARAATPADDAYSITVQFADLNLDHKAGAAKLYFRIRAAAKRVCGEQANERLVAKQTYAICVKRAVSAAITRIDRPMLSDYFAQLGGKLATTAPENVAAR